MFHSYSGREPVKSTLQYRRGKLGWERATWQQNMENRDRSGSGNLDFHSGNCLLLSRTAEGFLSAWSRTFLHTHPPQWSMVRFSVLQPENPQREGLPYPPPGESPSSSVVNPELQFPRVFNLKNNNRIFKKNPSLGSFFFNF